jgi:hypothetical protein
LLFFASFSPPTLLRLVSSNLFLNQFRSFFLFSRFFFYSSSSIIRMCYACFPSLSLCNKSVSLSLLFLSVVLSQQQQQR